MTSLSVTKSVLQSVFNAFFVALNEGWGAS
jgi:hypothetical protein